VKLTEWMNDPSTSAPAEDVASQSHISVPQSRILGTGEMADRTRSFDWSKTPIGPIEQWPDVLLVLVNTLLATRHPMLLWWGDDLIQFYNDAYRPSLGYDKHPKALGQKGVDCWQEIWPVIGPQVEAVMTHGEASWHENQLVPIYRNGELEDVYWTYSYSPVRDSGGAIRGTLVTTSETTGRVLAEQKVRASQERYRALFELASDPIFIADVDGRICEVNLAACQLLGYTRSELLQRNYADLIPEADVPRLWQARDELLDGGVGVEQWCLITAGGLTVNAEVSAAILPDGRWQAFLRDITDRKRLEQERSLLISQLQQERKRLVDLFEQAPALFAVLRGPEHIFEMINPLYQELLGERNLLGKPVRVAVPEAEQQGFFELLDRVYQTGEPFVGHGIRIHLARSAGQPLEERFLDFVYQPIREADGGVSGIIALGVDVTERKRTEEALIQAEKLTAVGRLASSIAHEINNPLEAVTNLLFLVQTSTNRSERESYLAQAQEELARVARISTQTLRFHRQSTRAKETSLREVMEGVLTLNQGRINGGKIKVSRRYRTHRQIMAYEADLRQVFANLIGNALDASQEGGRLTVSVRDSVDWSSGERGVRASIADTGCGMSPETRRRIFEPFFTTKGFTGTGLGLWVSSGILQNHRARICVRSSQNAKHHGTVFSIFFPVDGPQFSPTA